MIGVDLVEDKKYLSSHSFEVVPRAGEIIIFLKKDKQQTFQVVEVMHDIRKYDHDTTHRIILNVKEVK